VVASHADIRLRWPQNSTVSVPLQPALSWQRGAARSLPSLQAALAVVQLCGKLLRGVDHVRRSSPFGVFAVVVG